MKGWRDVRAGVVVRVWECEGWRGKRERLGIFMPRDSYLEQRVGPPGNLEQRVEGWGSVVLGRSGWSRGEWWVLHHIVNHEAGAADGKVWLEHWEWWAPCN